MIAEGVLKSFEGRSVLVTGGTGLIGRQVVDLLCSAGAYVKIVSLDRIRVHDKAEHIYADLTSFEQCKDVTKDMDCVCHLAGIKGSIVAASSKLASHFVPTMMMNTNVLEACRINKIRKLVYTSSIGAYPNAEVMRESEYRLDSIPMDFAGWAKRMAELQIHAYKVQYGLEHYSIVRPSNVYGPGDNFDPKNAMVIPALMSRIYRGENPVVIWGDGGAVRDFAFSRDVAEGILLALFYGTRAAFVNLGGGVGVTISDLVETLHRVVPFTHEFDASRSSGYPKRIMDISLAKEMIHYNPTTSLLDGIRKTWEWFTRNESEHVRKKNYFTETACTTSRERGT